MSVYSDLDVDVDERWWQLYLNWAQQHGEPATIRDFVKWKELEYDEA